VPAICFGGLGAICSAPALPGLWGAGWGAANLVRHSSAAGAAQVKDIARMQAGKDNNTAKIAI
jgi:hypothetical protein